MSIDHVVFSLLAVREEVTEGFGNSSPKLAAIPNMEELECQECLLVPNGNRGESIWPTSPPTAVPRAGGTDGFNTKPSHSLKLSPFRKRSSWLVGVQLETSYLISGTDLKTDPKSKCNTCFSEALAMCIQLILNLGTASAMRHPHGDPIQSIPVGTSGYAHYSLGFDHVCARNACVAPLEIAKTTQKSPTGQLSLP